MGQNPILNIPRNPIVQSLMLGSIGEAAGNQQIREEIKENIRERSNAFNEAIQRDLNRSIQQQEQQIQQQMEVDEIDQQQNSPRAGEASEEQPLLRSEEELVIQQIIQAQPEQGRQILYANIERIPNLLSIQGLIENKEKIQEIGKYLWEWFYVNKQEADKSDKFQDKPIFDGEVPPHCKIQYFWDETKQKVVRIMICNDESRNERVYYGV